MEESRRGEWRRGFRERDVKGKRRERGRGRGEIKEVGKGRGAGAMGEKGEEGGGGGGGDGYPHPFSLVGTRAALLMGDGRGGVAASGVFF